MRDTTLQLEHWPIERLIDYVRNPRKNDHAVAQMAGAIVEYGFRIPIIARSSGVPTAPRTPTSVTSWN